MSFQLTPSVSRTVSAALSVEPTVSAALSVEPTVSSAISFTPNVNSQGRGRKRSHESSRILTHRDELDTKLHEFEINKREIAYNEEQRRLNEKHELEMKYLAEKHQLELEILKLKKINLINDFTLLIFSSSVVRNGL